MVAAGSLAGGSMSESVDVFASSSSCNSFLQEIHNFWPGLTIMPCLLSVSADAVSNDRRLLLTTFECLFRGSQQAR